MMNKTIYIFVALVLVVALGWVNVYDYIPDGTHGIYRINRLTHQVDFDMNGDEWRAVRGGGD